MAEYLVEDAGRLVERNINERFDNDIYREIAELVTNSLDSYNRLSDFSGIREVRVEVGKAQRKGAEKHVIRVIDNAEGMSEEDMKRIFTKRGEDNNKGDEFTGVRGVFGLGASDVMRVSALQGKSAEYYSFKNGKCTNLRYKFEEGSTQAKIVLNPITKENEVKGLRDKFGIQGNGTAAVFGVPDECVLGETIEEIKHGIESLFLLRNVLMDDNNHVTISAYNEKLRLSTNNDTYRLSEPFATKETKFEFKKRTFKVKMDFIINEKKNENDIDILVQDDRGNIYDNQNQMFGYKKSQGAEKLSAIFTLIGFYDELDYFLNEIKISLLKDDRSGFDINKAFGKKLSDAVSPFINEVIKQISVSQTRANVSLSNTKNYREFLSFLNNDLNSTETIGRGKSPKEIKPPVGSIEFVRSKAALTAGKKYDLKIDINKELISTGDEILISAIENNDNIKFTESIIVDASDLVDEIPQKSVLIEGNKPTGDVGIILVANCNGTTTTCEIRVIEDEVIYPENGIAFEKEEVTITPDVTHKKIKLYFDLEKLSDEEVVVTNDSNGKLTIEKTSFLTTEGTMLSDTIGFWKVELYGGDLGDDYHIVASCSLGSTEILAKVRASVSKPHGGLGDIADYELCYEDYMGQAFYDSTDHKIKIITKNKINNQFVSEWRQNPKPKDL